MLSSVLDSLRAWPAVRRSTLSLLLPCVDGAVAWVDDNKVTAALRALGYSVVRPGNDQPSPHIVAVTLRSRGDLASSQDPLDHVRAESQRVPDGSWLLLRAPRKEQERLAAAFLHAGLGHVSQVVLRRSVLTVGQKRPAL